MNLRCVLVWILLSCPLFSILLAQNPFDVYRTGSQTTESASSTPKLTEPLASSIDNPTPADERIAATRRVTTHTGNPFDIYSRNAARPASAIRVDLTESITEVIEEEGPDRESFNAKPLPLPSDSVSLPIPATEVMTVEPSKNSDGSNPFEKRKGTEGAKTKEALEVKKESSIQAEEPETKKEISAPVIDLNPEVELEKGEKAVFRNIFTNSIFWIQLFFLILLTIVVNLNRGLIPELSKSLFNDNYLRVTHREYSKGFTPILYYLLYFNFFVQGGIFLHQSQQVLTQAESVPWLYISVALIAFYLLKHGVLYFLGNVFPVKKETSQFNFIIMQFNLFLGLLFLGLNWLLAFSPDDVAKIGAIVGLVSISGMYFVRQLRGLLVSSRILSAHIFHFFIYLCAVEIAPLLILFKQLWAHIS